MSAKKRLKIRKGDIMAKSSENCKTVKTEYLIFLDSYRFSISSLDKLSTTIEFFPSLDANRSEDDLFKRKLASPYKKGKSTELFYKPLKL